jgi:hypothetical protein
MLKTRVNNVVEITTPDTFPCVCVVFALDQPGHRLPTEVALHYFPAEKVTTTVGPFPTPRYMQAHRK